MSLARPADRIRVRAARARAPRSPWVGAEALVGEGGPPDAPQADQVLGLLVARPPEERAGKAGDPPATPTQGGV